jgi:hypothetical protein
MTGFVMADSDVHARARQEARRRSLMREVERALVDALSESREMHQVLLRLNREGLTLRLSIDCDSDDDSTASTPTTNERRADAGFRIDAEDLRFLRSIGIDPTRRRRSRQAR